MYTVRFTPDAEAHLAALRKPIAQRVVTKLRWLAEHVDDIEPEQLTGKLRDFYKLRVGDYRLLYTLNTTTHVLVVHYVGHRREIYKTR